MGIAKVRDNKESPNDTLKRVYAKLMVLGNIHLFGVPGDEFISPGQIVVVVWDRLFWLKFNTVNSIK